MIDRRTVLTAAAGLGAAAAAGRGEAAPPDPPETVRLWPGEPPGATARSRALAPRLTERSTDPAWRDRIAEQIADPILTVLRPERPGGAGLLLIPGGGYRLVSVDNEGLDCARVFAAAGVTCFVLRHRLPCEGWADGPLAPLQDAQRAMRLIRAGAGDFGVEPGRVAVLGASAGGHLAGMLCARPDEATYAPVDEADARPTRPDAALLLYPVAALAGPHAHAGSRERLLGPSPTPAQLADWSLEARVGRGFPPAFLVHAMDDASVPVGNSLMVLAALRAAGVRAEAHLFDEGGHGFGVRRAQGLPAEAWPRLALAWGRRVGWLAA